MNKYVHSNNDEWFDSKKFDSIKSCIEDAKIKYKEQPFYIGTVENFDKFIGLGYDMVEQFADKIHDETGISCMKEYMGNKKVGSIKRVDSMLWKAFKKWVEEEKENLDYCKVKDIKKINKYSKGECDE